MDGTLPAIMPFLDAGLYPFIRCSTCAEMMPVNITSGPFGTVLVTCCKCKVPSESRLLRFLSREQAAELGWGFEEASTALAN